MTIIAPTSCISTLLIINKISKKFFIDGIFGTIVRKVFDVIVEPLYHPIKQ